MASKVRHATADQLARLAVGELGPRLALRIATHVAACVRCRLVGEQLGGLGGLLASVRCPPMPEYRLLRVQAMLAAEASKRAALGDLDCWAAFSQGVADSAAGFVPFGHLCWAYHNVADFAARALEYAADGIAAGQYVELVGDSDTAGLCYAVAELVSPVTARGARYAGAAGTRAMTDFFKFDRPGVIDQDATIAARVAAADEALAAGYTGLRTVMDVTPAVRNPRQRQVAARLEYLLDQKMRSAPLCAMCGYCARELGQQAVAELACLHPFISRGAAPFRLYATADADFGLAGTIESTADDLFEEALRRISPPAGPELVVDAREVESIDDGALASLEAYAARIGRRASILRR